MIPDQKDENLKILRDAISTAIEIICDSYGEDPEVDWVSSDCQAVNVLRRALKEEEALTLLSAEQESVSPDVQIKSITLGQELEGKITERQAVELVNGVLKSLREVGKPGCHSMDVDGEQESAVEVVSFDKFIKEAKGVSKGHVNFVKKSFLHGMLRIAHHIKDNYQNGIRIVSEKENDRG